VPRQRRLSLHRSCDACDAVTSRSAQILLSDEMWSVDDAGGGDEDEDVAECERDGCEAAAAASRVGEVRTQASAARARRPYPQRRTARSVAGVGSAPTATTDRGDSGRCSRTTAAADCCPARSPTTRPSCGTVGRRTAGRGLAPPTTAENTVPDRRVRRYRGQSPRR